MQLTLTRSRESDPSLGQAPQNARRWTTLCLLVAVCVASWTLLALRLHHEFLPEDDTVLAHTAQRVLQGETPQLDFHDNYTGLLTYINALALKLFGIHILSMRIMLAIFFAVWIPALWFIALRCVGPLAASCLTLLSAAWTVPLYPAPLASWYNLFFATFGTAALFRYIELRKSRWLFVAGLFAGLSFLIKIAGLYFVAAALLFLAFEDQRPPSETRKSVRSLSAVLTFVLLAFDLTLFMLIRTRFTAATFYHFVLPGLMLTVFFLWREWSFPQAGQESRIKNILAKQVPFLCGMLLPVFVLLFPYLYSGKFSRWFAEVFVLPTTRIQFTFVEPASPWLLVATLPLFAVLVFNDLLRGTRTRQIAFTLLMLVAGLLLVIAIKSSSVASLVWLSASISIPVLTLFGILLIARSPDLDARDQSQLILLLLVMGLCSLIQFPFSIAFYFCFVLPFALLLFAALARQVSPVRNLTGSAPVFAFYFAYVLLVVYPAQVHSQGLKFRPRPERPFTLPRVNGIYADAEIADIYERAVPVILHHAGGAPIYATPHCPEFYFLTALKNPTPNLWDFVSGQDAAPDRVLKSISAAGVRVVIINNNRSYGTEPLSAGMLNELRTRYTESTMIGQFEIRWSDSHAAH